VKITTDLPYTNSVDSPDKLTNSDLKGFSLISLGEISSAKLLDRFDRKFIMSHFRLAELFKSLMKYYRVVTIEGQCISQYQTRYHDTSDLHMYTEHQNGRGNRFKIRHRTYVDSDLSFLEVKKKNNKGRTIKKRKKILDGVLDSAFIQKHSKYNGSDLRESLLVEYQRITLVNEDLTTRITIDVGLRFKVRDRQYEYPHLVILELKRKRSHGKTTIDQIIKDHNLRPIGLSKYCLGISSLYPDVKKNRMKYKLRIINKILNSSDTMSEGENNAEYSAN